MPRCRTAWTSSRRSRPAPAAWPTGSRHRYGGWISPISPPATCNRWSTGCSARAQLAVERLTRDGRRTVDVRSAVLKASVDVPPNAERAIMEAVVRQVTPAVRPDDIVAALRAVAGLAQTLRRGPTRRCGWRRGRSTELAPSAIRLLPIDTASDVVGLTARPPRSSDRDFASAPTVRRRHRLRAAAVTLVASRARGPNGETRADART